ncbi:hypothetical protein [Halopseudomonas oceani]|uniref:hypothetical protein n=1 Tax=Halopseudomonas oceani TaxID=1708783 RepID=UPI002AA88230|nr:hypothetical protein [Halopseudomonas oceani]
MRRTSWNKTAELSEKMKWGHAEDPAAMAWTVKAIDHKIMNRGDSIIVPCTLGAAVGLYSMLLGEGRYAGVFYISVLLGWFLFYKDAMQKTVFVYRATSEHLEVCRWQDIPDMVFIFLRVFPFLMIGVLLMLLISNPALSIAALAGPALVGIGLASVGGDSSYQTYWQDFHHDEYLWSEVLEAMLDAEQGLIVLTLPYELPAEYAAQIENPEQFTSQDVRLYFRKDQQTEVIAMVKDRIPDIELTPGRQIYEL